jgi:formylglycine-generating enzyme required for sulfatase activity
MGQEQTRFCCISFYMKQIRILLLLAATLIAATTALRLVEVKGNDTDLTKAGTVFRDCPDCPEMVMLPQGRFVMAAPPGEEERENVMDYFRGHSVPQHLVTIRYRLAIAKFDVTRDEYAQFVAETNRPDPDSCYGPDESGRESDKKGANWHSPGFPQTGKDPVVCVNGMMRKPMWLGWAPRRGMSTAYLRRLSGNTRRAQERRRRVTAATVLRNSAAISIVLIWNSVSCILTRAA